MKHFVTMTLADLIPTLQMAIGPVILISGVGLLLLSMTNRFARIIDRSRLNARELQTAPDGGHHRLHEQLAILSKRARLVRAAIATAALSVLLAALLIIGLFLGILLQVNAAGLIVMLFVLCLLSLIVSLVLFILDINLSLKALWLEMPEGLTQRD